MHYTDNSLQTFINRRWNGKMFQLWNHFNSSSHTFVIKFGTCCVGANSKPVCRAYRGCVWNQAENANRTFFSGLVSQHKLEQLAPTGKGCKGLFCQLGGARV